MLTLARLPYHWSDYLGPGAHRPEGPRPADTHLDVAIGCYWTGLVTPPAQFTEGARVTDCARTQLTPADPTAAQSDEICCRGRNAVDSSACVRAGFWYQVDVHSFGFAD